MLSPLRRLTTVSVAALVLLVATAVPSAATEPDPAEVSPLPAPPLSTGSGIDDSVVRLYVAVFDRRPDADGLAFWVDRYRNGASLDAIAQSFVESGELTRTYGDLDTAGFVERVYANVLDRAPDPDGFAHWTAALERRALTRGQLMVRFSESSEMVRLTRTLPPEAPPRVVPAGSGEGRRVIYCVSCQRVWLVEDSGYLTRRFVVSGRANTPAPGTYRVFSKSERAWAGYGGITMEYMVRYAWGRTLPLGFHSIPKRPDGTFLQTEDELGQYRSAGCTRMRLADARFLYEWAPVGTTVVVLA